ncbi:MAG: phosphotransferase [Gemmatimonadetes bacterium]|nr:phosphotransferase [Gemmatimonadota bacterium]
MALPPELTPPDSPADWQLALPSAMRGPATTLTRIGKGMSGAAVFRVDAGDHAYVLKLTSPDEPLGPWQARLAVQRAAATAGLAPELVHVDEARRAVLSALVVDRSWPAQFGNPATRGAAIHALGRMLAHRAHLPTPPGMGRADVRPVLQAMWSALSAEATLPLFVRETVTALLAEPPVTACESLVMSHNDVNPSNLVFDGTRVMLLDWDTAAPNDPLYDLATVAMFFRMDHESCQQLVAAHDDAPIGELPEAFRTYRRCAAALSGVAALGAARSRGHAGGEIAAEATPSLGEVYQQLRAGTIDIQSVAGQWTFGLALVKEAAGLPR